MPRTRCCMTWRSGTTSPGWASPCAATIRALPQLERKARGFDAADRRMLLELVGELLAGVLPRFRALADAGRCELAVSPYSHPILPLLFDFDAAREGEPAARLPRHAALSRWRRARCLAHAARGGMPRACVRSQAARLLAVRGRHQRRAVGAIEAAGFDWLATSDSDPASIAGAFRHAGARR